MQSPRSRLDSHFGYRRRVPPRSAHQCRRPHGHCWRCGRTLSHPRSHRSRPSQKNSTRLNDERRASRRSSPGHRRPSKPCGAPRRPGLRLPCSRRSRVASRRHRHPRLARRRSHRPPALVLAHETVKPTARAAPSKASTFSTPSPQSTADIDTPENSFTRLGGHAHAVGFRSLLASSFSASESSVRRPRGSKRCWRRLWKCGGTSPRRYLASPEFFDWLTRCEPIRDRKPRTPYSSPSNWPPAEPPVRLVEKHICLELEQAGEPRRLAHFAESHLVVDWPARSHRNLALGKGWLIGCCLSRQSQDQSTISRTSTGAGRRRW